MNVVYIPGGITWGHLGITVIHPGSGRGVVILLWDHGLGSSCDRDPYGWIFFQDGQGSLPTFCRYAADLTCNTRVIRLAVARKKEL